MTIRVLLVVVTGVLAILGAPWWLILGADVVAYLVWAYAHPWRPCRRCKGTGVNAMSTLNRNGRCRRCGGGRQVKTLGSRAMHRAVRAIRQPARTGWK